MRYKYSSLAEDLDTQAGEQLQINQYKNKFSFYFSIK